MPNSCSAIGCTNRHRTGENIRFYGFPLKKKELLTLWLRALKRKNFKPTKYSKVCSDHFVEDDYLPRPGTYIKRLKPDAVPSIFSQFPSYYQKKKVERKNIQHSKRTNSNEVASTSSQFQIAEHSLDVIPNETQVLPSTVTREIQTNLSGSELDETTNSLKHKVKVLQQKLRRRNKKITNIVDLLKTLRKRNLIEQQVETLLQNKFEGMAQELFKNELHNTESTNMGRRYSREMKEFALTLHFHSPKAYNFCRTILKLPHPSAITRWTCSVNAEPGFFKDVFAVLSTFPLEDRDCNLILDGMSIRKQQLWNNAKGCFEGYCDFGNNFQIEDSDALATEALVFMLVSLNGKWKLPIGFVLQNKSTAIIQAQLIKTALTLSYESGLRVLGVTCDGAPTNFSSLDMLGCKIKGHFKYFQTSFKLDNHENDICFIPDACHMLKLARNTLAEYQQFQSSDGVIMWQYIVKLYELQNELGFKFANKLGKSHVEWEHNKMKVKLAAQVISSSVADALEFLKNRDIEIFRDCKETIQFIRVVDKLFDFLNSRNPYGKGFKKPIYPDNLQYLESEIMPLIEYLFTLKDMNGSFLHMGKKKTFIVGIATAVKSVFILAKQLFSMNPTYKYLLTYKLSQDHIELLFSKIRQRFGFNNNPNVVQFKSAIKQILLKNSIASSSAANCAILDSDRIGNIFEISYGRQKFSEEVNPEESAVDQDLLQAYGNLLLDTNASHTDLKENILYYISGFIVKCICKRITCISCMSALISADNTREHNYSRTTSYNDLVYYKNRGGLISASRDVFNIVKATEMQINVSINDSNLSSKNLKNTILFKVKHYFALDNATFRCLVTMRQC